MMMKML